MGTQTCPYCGAQVVAENRFCSECGKPMTPTGSFRASDASAKRPDPKATVIAFQSPVAKGVMGQAAGGQAPAPEAVQKTRAAGAAAPVEQPALAGKSDPGQLKGKTMLGIPGQQFGAYAAEPLQPEAQPSAQEPAPPRPESQAAQPAQPAAAPAAAGIKSHAKTMLGVPMSVPFAKPETAPAPGAPAPAASAQEPPAAPASVAAASDVAGRTILGVPLGPEPGEFKLASPVAPVQPAAPAAGPAPDTGRTILGVAAAAEEKPAVSPATKPAFVAAPVEEEREFPEKTIGKTGSKGMLAAAAVALAVVMAAGVALMLVKGKQSNVRARVVAVEDGEGILFEVPGAAVGSKIRFGGQEKSLEAGRATFLLAPDSVRAGENVVLFDVLYAGGKTESASITLSVDFRIRVDTAPLQTDEPAIDVLVNALPGTTVTIDGKPLELDKEGRGVRRYPIDAAAALTSGVFEQVVKYRIQPKSGEATVDELRTKIAVASMQIDRPGLESVTDKDAIEIAGAVAPSSRVAVDGQPVEVKAGRFLYRLPLPQPGVFQPRVVAREPGKAPRVVALTIKRVADLKKEAASFKVDPALNYARIAQNPSIYSGQKVALEGRVYNVNVQGGQSVLQMLVRECPSGARCAIWVTYPFATEAVVDSWVRVLGTVEGQQQFRSENNKIVTVPKIAAAYVLPIKR